MSTQNAISVTAAATSTGTTAMYFMGVAVADLQALVGIAAGIVWIVLAVLRYLRDAGQQDRPPK